MNDAADSEVTVLDVKGLACPLPVLRARKVLKTLPDRGVIEVLSTDQASLEDFRAFCRQTGDDLVSQRTEEGVYITRIRKAAR